MRSTSYDQRVFMLVPAARRAAANTALAALGFGADTFSQPLGATQAGPTTHYFCDWQLTAAELTAVETALQGVAGLVVQARDHWDSRQGAPATAAFLAGRGLARK